MTDIDTELLARDVAALHAAHAAGTWHPLPAETAASDSLARGQWTGPLFRTVLRDTDPALASGSLAGVLESAAALLEDPVAANRPEAINAMVRLRQLADVLADDT